ncbi:hypothetical protein ACFL2V_04925 [Pseudomonadota bacterium]
MNGEYLTPASEYDDSVECCDLYGEYCYPCSPEKQDDTPSSEELGQ